MKLIKQLWYILTPAEKTEGAFLLLGMFLGAFFETLSIGIVHAPPQIPDFQIVFVHMRRHDGLLVHRSTWPENLVVIRRCTCHLGFWLLLHAPENIARSYHVSILLLMSSDVI